MAKNIFFTFRTQPLAGNLIDQAQHTLKLMNKAFYRPFQPALLLSLFVTLMIKTQSIEMVMNYDTRILVQVQGIHIGWQ